MPRRETDFADRGGVPPRGLAVAALSLFLLSGLAACRAETVASRPNLLLITLDTVRADRLGCYGYALGSTPALDGLAARGVRFEQAVTPVPVTLPSHASLFTATYPRVHGARANGQSRLSPDATTLAERLRDAGWRTAAIVSADVLARFYGLDQGFESYRDDVQARPGGALHGRRAGEVTDLVLNELRGREEPWFVWAHYWDPHTPYDPPPPFDRRFAERPYDGEIAYMDQELGRLFRSLDASGASEHTLVVVVADHGEGLGEHGEPEHGVFLYETTLRVPMLLAGPGVPAGTTVEAPVRTIDLAPTLLELVGLSGDPNVQGRSLVSLLRGESSGDERDDVLMESEFGRIHYGWSPLVGIRVGDWKYVHAPIPELFDLGTDPGETENLAASRADVRGELHAELERALAGLPPPIADPNASATSLSAADRRRLAALGYLVGGGAGSGPGTPPGPDPKTRIPVIQKVSGITRALQQGHTEAAITELRALFAEDPDSTFAALTLADALTSEGRVAEASAVLERLVAAAPANAQARLQFGISLMNERRLDEARDQFQAALHIFPDMASAEEKLGVTLAMMGDLPGARAHLERAIAIAPSLPEAHVNLGLVSLQLGDASAAEQHFRRALELRPGYPLARKRLDELLQREGRTD